MVDTLALVEIVSVVAAVLSAIFLGFLLYLDTLRFLPNLS
jgi:hypothetical protein